MNIKSFLKYIPWAFIQQSFVLCIFLLFSKGMSFESSIALSCLIFSLLHTPNLFLMILTLAIQPLFLYLYVDFYSLIWIMGTHAFTAIWVKTYLPETITKGMRVLWNYKF
jgi:membrane protease YdiL (CAAX protease family)